MDKLHEQLAVELRVSELYLIARLRTLEKLMDADSRFAVGEVAEDLRKLRGALAAYDAAKARAGNYVADREIAPREVRFTDGRTVRVVGDGYLEVERG